MDLLAARHHAALGGAGERGDGLGAAHGLQHVVEFLDLEQRLGFFFVGKKNVELRQQRQELVAISSNEKRVGQGEGDFRTRPLGNLDGFERRGFGGRRIPEITLNVKNFRGRDFGFLDIRRREFARRAEIGIHAALAVRRHRDQAARGGGTGMGWSGGVLDTELLHALAEGRAQTVLLHLAGEDAARAKRGQPGHRIGRGAAGDLARACKGGVELFGAKFVD